MTSCYIPWCRLPLRAPTALGDSFALSAPIVPHLQQLNDFPVCDNKTQPPRRYFDQSRLGCRFRDGWYCDGGLTNFVPIPPGVERPVRARHLPRAPARKATPDPRPAFAAPHRPSAPGASCPDATPRPFSQLSSPAPAPPPQVCCLPGKNVGMQVGIDIDIAPEPNPHGWPQMARARVFSLPPAPPPTDCASARRRRPAAPAREGGCSSSRTPGVPSDLVGARAGHGGGAHHAPGARPHGHGEVDSHGASRLLGG